ncbi:MAG: anion permease [Oscillospiraceae bacterium]|nr:anion permease [Oscillospiraceae bacterium]
MNKIKIFLKKEPVLSIAAVLAVVSAFLVPPSAGYIAYIDFRVLALLFCLMAVVAGFIDAGFFDFISSKLLGKTDKSKTIALLLVNLCFFSAMLVTNDVALLTFVPLTLGILGALPASELIFVLVMETIAANLGSMATPVGNPQNLYLYSRYAVSLPDFFATLAPLTLLSWLLIMAVMKLRKGSAQKLTYDKAAPKLDKQSLLILAALFLLCIAAVVHLIPYQLCFVVVLLSFLLWKRQVLKAVDYTLLLTFVCFFVFVGNMGELEAVRTLVSNLLEGRELLVSALTSQLISNVPAALMLSGFTENGTALLIGTNIGGLGTLWASLASLITFKLYSRHSGAESGRFFSTFTLWNVIFLVVLLLISLIIY